MARRVRRSSLTMPINNPNFVGRSWTRNCDYLNFDFEDSGHKEFPTLERSQPISEEENKIMDEGICEVCECYSGELKEIEGKWVCESCVEE